MGSGLHMATSNQVEFGIKLSAVKEYLAGSCSLNKIAEKYGCML